MQLHYICPHWGQEQTPPEAFINKVIAAGYAGIEINAGGLEKAHWLPLLKSTREKHPEFIVVAQYPQSSPEADQPVYHLYRSGARSLYARKPGQR
ncbi:hypothetical protein [Niabella drilacis]|uniref:Xylose isomerase-like TIM barrel n=1 Tax=Niabella drilacis (strain DSM 25811 / CCM 8410 / CCUG 62505 / LMG 26954 / E90) TaxID=1285928 RepID=A0A1G6PZ22_NIADE|nr:hypothetical protein [Niabella drilacis]SDC85442.1 hypothetical protein SAMN04487894_104219 [Niabella drilacis]